LHHHAIQRALWLCKKRFVSVPAGRGSGKTELLKRRLVRCLPIPKPWGTPRYFYGAPTEAQAKRIAWNHFLQLIPKNWIHAIKTAELKIETVFGSELYVTGMDKPQRAEGIQWDGCGLDESCDLKPKVFELVVLPMLAHRLGWCWRIGVPKRFGPSATEFRKFHEGACSGQIPDAAGFTWASDDILSDEQLEYARRMMATLDYREQFGGVFVDAGGGVFHAFSESYNVRRVEYHHDQAIVVGSDFNVNPMAWVLGHRYKNRMEWFDEIYMEHTNTPATLRVLYERYKSHVGGFEFYGDATGQQNKSSAEQSDYNHIASDKRFHELGCSVHYPSINPPVSDRFAACNAMFCNVDDDCRMFVDPSCAHLIDDLRTRAYKPGTKEADDKQGRVRKIGHMTDAMGYPVFRLFPVDVELRGAGTQEITISVPGTN